MNFLSPLAGLIAASIAVPALLLLYFLKLRRREQVVPSTLLWRKAIQDLQVNAPFQRLRRNLLLFLQMLILLALAIALAQPTIPFRPPTGSATVLLIDRSASMSAKDGDDKNKSTRLDEAKKRSKELLSTLGKGAKAMVIAFDDRAEILQSFTTDTALLSRTIDAITPSDRPTKLKLAYQLADAQNALRGVAAQDDITPPDVWVYSDGRASDVNDLSLRAKVHYEAIGSDKSANIGIVSLSARRNYERPTEVQVFARLANSGPNPNSADVQLTVDGAIQKVARVHLVPDRWTEQQRQEFEKGGGLAHDAVEFTLDLPQAAVVRLEQMTKEGDVFPADDAASVIVPPPKSLAVTLVTTGADPFLRDVIRAQKLRDTVEITPEQYEANRPTGRDIIFFDNYRPQGLPPTGNFVHFGSLPNGLRLTAKTTPTGNLLTNPDFVGVLDFNREHPILRGLALGKIVAKDALFLQPASESEILIEGTAGPLLVLHREGRQIHLACAFDPLNSDWPVRPSFPVFFHNLFQYFATASDLAVRESYPPGSTPRLPAPALENLTGKIKITGPSLSAEVDLPKEGDLALPSLDHVGVYDLSPAPAGFERLAVNLLDPNESNILPAGSPPGGIGEAVATKGTSKARLELWWYLIAAAAIPILLIEWFVYTRRTHL